MAERNTQKTILSETMTALFCKAETDLDTLEKAEKSGISAKATFDGSSEDLLRAILNPGDNWNIAKDSDPYGKVKAAIIDRAHDLKRKLEIPGSIASGKWRAQARESEDQLIRLAGRLAGRLSTLMSKANPDRRTRGTGTGTGTGTGKSTGKSTGEDYEHGWEDALAAVVNILDSGKDVKKRIMTLWYGLDDDRRKAAEKRRTAAFKAAA